MKAIFLDRDGTIIEEPPDEVVDSIDKIKILPNALCGLESLKDADFSLFIITNQIGISQGRLSIEEFHIFNNHFLKQLESKDIHISDIFFCPHSPEDNCECRKPKSGLIEQAKQKYEINLNQSYVIGDRKSDILLGKEIGAKTILVQTDVDFTEEELSPDFVAKDLLDVANYILSSSS